MEAQISPRVYQFAFGGAFLSKRWFNINTMPVRRFVVVVVVVVSGEDKHFDLHTGVLPHNSGRDWERIVNSQST